MLDKIQSYFGFTTMPFGRGLAPGMLFRSGDHAQAAARIGYGIATRGITVITGEVGVGKTVAARAAIDRLPSSGGAHHVGQGLAGREIRRVLAEAGRGLGQTLDQGHQIVVGPEIGPAPVRQGC